MPSQLEQKRHQKQTVRRGMCAASHDWEPMHEHCPGCGRRAPNHHERLCAVCGVSMLRDRIVWNKEPERLATRCLDCNGQGVRKLTPAECVGTSCADRIVACDVCCGSGWLGVDPLLPTDLRAGSEVKVIVLAVRYAAGLPLWHVGDHREVVPLNVIVIPDAKEAAGSGDPRRAPPRKLDAWRDEFPDEFPDELPGELSGSEEFAEEFDEADELSCA